MAGVARAQPCRPQQEVHADGRLNGRSAQGQDQWFGQRSVGTSVGPHFVDDTGLMSTFSGLQCGSCSETE